jgi:hypothetical protein
VVVKIDPADVVVAVVVAAVDLNGAMVNLEVGKVRRTSVVAVVRVLVAAVFVTEVGVAVVMTGEARAVVLPVVVVVVTVPVFVAVVDVIVAVAVVMVVEVNVVVVSLAVRSAHVAGHRNITSINWEHISLSTASHPTPYCETSISD